MAAGYWLKLYTEILGDFKYHKLSDEAKLGFYELLLVAKDAETDDGLLPEFDELSFKTRREESWWSKVTLELEQAGILTENENGALYIKNFSKRQAPIPGNERQYQSRKKKSRDEFSKDGENDPVTNCDINSDDSSRRVDIEIEKETEKEEDVDVSSAAASDISNEVRSSWVEGGLIAQFEQISGLTAPIGLAKVMEKWQDALVRLVNMGADEAVMRQAAEEMTGKNYKIAGPWSLERPCAMILAERKRENIPKAERKKDCDGPYAWALAKD